MKKNFATIFFFFLDAPVQLDYHRNKGHELKTDVKPLF